MLRKFTLSILLFLVTASAIAQSLSSIMARAGNNESATASPYGESNMAGQERTKTKTFGNSASALSTESGQASESGLGLAAAALNESSVRLPGSGDKGDAVAGISTRVFIPAQRLQDYMANQASDVFGADMFTGAFAKASPSTFNPDYVVSIGDSIRLRMWGGFDFDGVLTVDPQGIIFLPHCGPLHVLGTKNGDIQTFITAALRKVFSNKVSIYANLEAGQPVRVYVAGFVRHPGMYEGTGGDSVLKYLDMAGGVDPDRGTFHKVIIKRGDAIKASIDLYRFLLNGDISTPQISDGDVIFVGPRQNVVTVTGLASNAKLFEFSSPTWTLNQIIAVAHPDPRSTNVRITRSTGSIQNVEYYSVADAATVTVANGDVVDFTADKQQGTITVRVEGEHLGAKEYVVPYGTNLTELMSKIEMSSRSDTGTVQLFRESVREQQAKLLAESLTQLQNSVLTARSGTDDEAQLRQREASLVLQWVDRAKNVKPRGQIVVGSGAQWKDVVLENGDLVRIPPKDGMVLVGGEVLFPNTVVYQPGFLLEDYIQQAGGYTQNADSSRTIIAHEDGTFVDSRQNSMLKPGDQIMVLPKVDFKTEQFAKELFTILYQIAISAKVAIGL